LLAKVEYVLPLVVGAAGDVGGFVFREGDEPGLDDSDLPGQLGRVGGLE